MKILNIKVCVRASFDICRMHCLLLFAHPCGNLFSASRQLVWGTWKSQCQELNGKKLSDPPCQGILMVTLPQCHHSEDQALSRLYCQKSCLKITLSQGNWYPQPHSESNGFQVFQLLFIKTDHGTSFFFFLFFLSMNVNCHSTLWEVCSIHECVRVSRTRQKKRACRAVEPLTSDSRRPFKLLSSHCVLLSGLPQWQTLWKPEQALLGRGLTECFSDRHDCRECFGKIGKYDISIAVLKPSL